MTDIGSSKSAPIRTTLFPTHSDDTGAVVEVDHLVVGAGPAGASMGCFLGRHGITVAITSSVEGWDLSGVLTFNRAERNDY